MCPLVLIVFLGGWIIQITTGDLAFFLGGGMLGASPGNVCIFFERLVARNRGTIVPNFYVRSKGVRGN